jgi:hypothetical protein
MPLYLLFRHLSPFIAVCINVTLHKSIIYILIIIKNYDKIKFFQIKKLSSISNCIHTKFTYSQFHKFVLSLGVTLLHSYWQLTTIEVVRCLAEQ